VVVGYVEVSKVGAGTTMGDVHSASWAYKEVLLATI